MRGISLLLLSSSIYCNNILNKISSFMFHSESASIHANSCMDKLLSTNKFKVTVWTQITKSNHLRYCTKSNSFTPLAGIPQASVFLLLLYIKFTTTSNPNFIVHQQQHQLHHSSKSFAKCLNTKIA